MKRRGRGRMVRTFDAEMGAFGDFVVFVAVIVEAAR